MKYKQMMASDPHPTILPMDPLGDFRLSDSLLSRYTPRHYILDKGLLLNST